MSAAAVMGVIAIAVIAAVVVLTMSRGTGDENAAAHPSGSAAASGTATRSASVAPSPSGATAVPSVVASSTPAAASVAGVSSVRPDSAHGLITFTNIRTEADPKDLQQPPQFSRSPGATTFTAGVGVSPDGKQVALIRSGETGSQLITFATSKPNDVAIVFDFAGSGEAPGGVVWAGDGAGSVLFAVHKLSSPAPQMPTTYSTLRVVDVASRQVREVARITNGAYFFPIAWRSDRRIAAALEVAAGSAQSYDLARDGAPPERTMLVGSYGPVTASRDGLRIAAVFSPGPDAGSLSVRWWPMDQPGAAKEIVADSRGRAEYAAFRPGAPDELGVRVVPPTVGGAPPPGHFEIWNVSTGRQRGLGPTVGFQFWRVDGSAAIDGSSLIDPSNGATVQIPGGAFKIVDVIAF